MSYILEALKKAEHQREIGQVPRIDSEHEPALAGWSSRWVVVVVLVLLVNAGLLVVLFWPGGSADVSRQVAGSQALSPETRAMPAPETQHTDRPAAVANLPAVTNVPYRRENAVETRRATVPPQAPVIAPRQPVVQAVPITPAPAASESVLASESVAPAPVPARAMPAAPPPVPAPVEPARDLPVWPQVPTHIFQRIKGGLRLDVHVYSDSPQDRFVLINLQKYHEGERLQEGPLLDEITAEGIVLSLQGQQFLVRAQ